MTEQEKIQSLLQSGWNRYVEWYAQSGLQLLDQDELIAEVRRLTERCEAAEADLDNVVARTDHPECTELCANVCDDCCYGDACKPKWRGPQPTKEVNPDA